MDESDWTVQVLTEHDGTASGKPCLALVAARVPFDVDANQGPGPVLAEVRSGTERDRILVDFSSDAAGWTQGLGPPGSTGETWLRIGAEDLREEPSKVRLFRFEVDWDASDATCVVVWRKDPVTLANLWAPPDDPDGPQLLSFLSKRFAIFGSLQEVGGAGTRGGSNMLCEAVG